ncbi:MAG: HNH endonuclease [Candidatus Eisenbacteria bacterium]|nr:HNH endonuclease [Candidatus Eisenbacteria bacterium]
MGGGCRSDMVLQERALVLNRYWTAVGTTSVRTALCLLYRAAARAVHPGDASLHDFDSWASLAVAEGEPHVRAVRYRLKVPEIVLLSHYAEVPRRRVTFSRRNVYRRDRNICQYCGAKPPIEDLTVDHVLPRSLGGRTSWTNCVLSCVKCNRRKSNRTLAEAGVRLVREPHEPTWSPCLSIPTTLRKESWGPYIPELQPIEI